MHDTISLRLSNFRLEIMNRFWTNYRLQRLTIIEMSSLHLAVQDFSWYNFFVLRIVWNSMINRWIDDDFYELDIIAG